MIHPSVSDLPGLLLLVDLVVHSAVDHQSRDRGLFFFFGKIGPLYVLFSFAFDMKA